MDPYSLSRLGRMIHEERVREGLAWKATRWDDYGRVSAPKRTWANNMRQLRLQAVARSLIAALFA